MDPKQETRRIRKEAKGSRFAGKRGGDRATSNASCCVHQDCYVADEQKAALKKAAGVLGGKDECQM